MKKTREKFKHYFIPHSGNEYKAHIFREGSLSLLLAIVIGSFALGLLHQVALTNSQYLANIYSGVLVDLANEDREDSALEKLTINPVLERAAKMKADDMAARGYFAHYGPDGSSPWDWMKKAGYKFIYAGENLAIDFSDSSDVNKAWLNSPSHRANILNSKFTEIGIATAEGYYNGRKTIFVVQMFGTPQAQTLALPVTTTPVPVTQLAQDAPANTSPQVEGTSIEEVKPKPVPVTSSPKPSQVTTKTVAKAEIPQTPVTTVDSSSANTPASQETFIAVENAESIPVATNAENLTSKNDSNLMRMFSKVETNPISVVETIFAFVGLLIMIGLIGVVVRDLETHHLKHALGGALLMVVIVALAYIYKAFVFTSAVIVAMR